MTEIFLCSIPILFYGQFFLTNFVFSVPWQENLRPKISGYPDSENVYRFTGNTSQYDYFKLIVVDGNSLLVGSRNVVYNLTITDLNQNQILEWYSEQDPINMCVLKGKNEENCQNYIRILARTSTGKLLVCGTNSFKPLCREYSIEDGSYSKILEKPGQAICPYDPNYNSTFIYVDNELYSATVTDFAGTDPIIYREPLQTEQYDSMSLNAPNFVNSLTRGDYVYFFFRETAVEYLNCGKVVYSRVVRICKHDRGGPQRFRNRWTSFLKSRLNCSVHGDFPFYFNEIQSTSDWVDGKYGSLSSQLIYAVFTTPANSITGSAVCAFSLQDITDTFEGNFKEQKELNSNWLPVPTSKVPEPRPGQCVNDSRNLPDLTLSFIKDHSLMDEAVMTFFKQPVLISTSTGYRFTKIAVDPQVKAVNGKTYDILFIGTDNGKLIKAINTASADSHETSSPVIIEELQVFPTNVSIINLKVVRKLHRTRNEGRIIVVSDDEIISLSLHRCNNDHITSCSKCVSLQDPYCVWDRILGKCRSLNDVDRFDESHFYQSVTTGVHSACPLSELEKQAINVGGLSSNLNGMPTTGNGKYRDQSGVSMDAESAPVSQYSVETLVFGIVCGTGFALVVGFAIGYVCGRKCNKDDEDNIPYPDTEYEYFEQRQNVNVRRLAEPKLLPQEEVTYAEPVLAQCLSNSPKTTSLRKQEQHAFSPFQNDENYYPATSNDCITRMRDHFGTLRSQRNFNRADANASSLGYRGDGYNTTRSVKKVYL